MNLEFRWSWRKASLNLHKHGVSFEEASTIFYDEQALLIYDSIHSVDEERCILLGMSADSRVLVVVHLYWESADVVRIISARKATKREADQYFQRKK